MVELDPPGTRVLVDEADEVDAVLRVLEELARGELADLPRADDQGVLQVQRAPPSERTRGAAKCHDEDRREEPERYEAGNVRVSDSHEPGRDEVEPRAERDQVEDAHELVDRRMVDVLLVSLVESVELGGDDPERNRQQ